MRSPVRDLRSALVLGANGFLGRWLTGCLVDQGTEVIAFDRDPCAVRSGVNVVQADASDTATLSELLSSANVDVLFHLASAAYVPPSLGDPVADLGANVTTTLSVLEAVRRSESHPLVVLASSAAVYGHGQVLPMSEGHVVEPVSPYGVSKRAAELYVEMYHRVFDVSAFSVRMFSLYGPGQRKQVVFDLLCRLYAGEDPLVVSAPAEASRDLVYVADAASSLIKLSSEAPGRGEVYNLCTGVEVRLRQLADALVEAAEIDAEVSFTGANRRGDPLRWVGDPSLAAGLGAVATTPLEEGLRATAKWIRDDAAPAASRASMEPAEPTSRREHP